MDIKHIYIIFLLSVYSSFNHHIYVYDCFVYAIVILLLLLCHRVSKFHSLINGISDVIMVEFNITWLNYK